MRALLPISRRDVAIGLALAPMVLCSCVTPPAEPVPAPAEPTPEEPADGSYRFDFSAFPEP